MNRKKLLVVALVAAATLSGVSANARNGLYAQYAYNTRSGCASISLPNVNFEIPPGAKRGFSTTGGTYKITLFKGSCGGTAIGSYWATSKPDTTWWI